MSESPSYFYGGESPDYRPSRNYGGGESPNYSPSYGSGESPGYQAADNGKKIKKIEENKNKYRQQQLKAKLTRLAANRGQRNGGRLG